MLDMLEKYLNTEGVFEENLPENITLLSNTISNNIPIRMKLLFAISELMLFVSQFKINIKHWNNSSIPINSISFCIAPSGTAKDSSIKAVRKAFKEGYEIIEEYRKTEAENKAIKKAEENEEDNPSNWNVYKHYYKPPNPLFVAPSTTEGFIQHLNDLDELPVGSGYMFSGEIGAELTSNPTLTDNIKVISELYDEGSKEVKVLKDRLLQSKEIKNFPVSAMFMGSQDNILYDDVIKRKFKTEFTTKLARRSFFIFIDELPEKSNFNSIEQLITKEFNIETNADKNKETLSNIIKELTFALLDTDTKHITVSTDVRKLFVVYKEYNDELAKRINVSYPMARLTRNHLQWKALKLAGALAIFRFSDVIELDDYKTAIKFVEYINTDILNFEKELVKEPYELFTKYVQDNCIDNELIISLHTLRKMGYINFKGSPIIKMQELVQLATSYDPDGIYEIINNKDIHYKKLDKTDVILLSYVECKGSKAQRAKTCDKGYTCEEIKFEDLEQMLKGDYAYSPFKFSNNTRNKDNIESSCKWIFLDIDKSTITDKEAHILLSDIKHIIVRTSDKTNAFKFRVLIELDANVDIPNNKWNKFIKTIIEDLSLEADILPKSQIAFSYADRDIITNFEGEPLKVKKYIISIQEKDDKSKIVISDKEKISLLKNSLDTFEQAYQAKQGEGSRKLIWAAKYAKELGANKEEIINLMYDINNYWVTPMSEERLSNTIISQINRWEF